MTPDDTLSQFEFETAPFTPAELAAIMDYRGAIEGIPDSLTETGPDEMRAAATAFGTAGGRKLLADQCDALTAWYLALDTALAELLTCTTEATRYSTAAARFLKAESTAYHQARHHFEHSVTVFLLDRDTTPLIGNYPPRTNRLNLAMQSLEWED
jgi:hypothetical protein